DSFVSHGGNRLDFRGDLREGSRGAAPGGSSGGPAHEGGETDGEGAGESGADEGDRRCGPPAAGDRFDLEDAASAPAAPVRTTDDLGVVRVIRDDGPGAAQVSVAVESATGPAGRWAYPALAT